MDYKTWWKNEGKQYWSLGEDKPATDDQQQILYEIVTSIKNGCRNIILQLGVGFGKSAIAMTIANMYESSYILTNNVNLQRQYNDDFDDIKLLMGQTHYNCKERPDYDCGRCYIEYINNNGIIEEKLKYLSLSNSWEFPDCLTEKEWEDYLENVIQDLPLWRCYDCPYRVALRNARNNDCTIANYHSLHFHSNILNSFSERDLIVFDEGHHFEEILCGINSWSLNPAYIRDKYDLYVLEHTPGDNINHPIYWADIIMDIIDKIEEKKTRVMGELQGKVDDGIYKRTLHEFIIEINNWQHKWDLLVNGDYTVRVPDDYSGKIIIESVTSKSFNKELLDLGEIRIFMSGTFPRPRRLCKWFGLNYKETHFIRKYPDYPVENRAIHKRYVGRISGVRRDSWDNEKMESTLVEIAKTHDGENGVVHCSSNEQVNYVVDLLIDNGFDAYCCYDGGEENMSKQEIIDEFKAYGGILVGSNIREGLDLKGDYCTFQILFKVPWDSFPQGSRNKIRKERETPWYKFHTASRVEQAYGRGIRNKDDVCPFYVLDECFDDLTFLFSPYMKEAIL